MLYQNLASAALEGLSQSSKNLGTRGGLDTLYEIQQRRRHLHARPRRRSFPHIFLFKVDHQQAYADALMYIPEPVIATPILLALFGLRRRR